MKKRLILLIFLLISISLIFSLDILSSLEKLSSLKKVSNINRKILDEFEKEASVRVMIKYKEQQEIQSPLFSKQNFLTQEEILPIEKIHHQFKNEISATISKKDLIELENNLNIKSIEIISIRHIFLTESTVLTNATTTWTKQINTQNLTGKGETICILDTGTNFSHPDLQNKNLTCVIDCLTTNCPENCSVSDDHGHGTHVAGIASANGLIKGIAPEANLIAIKVCDSNGNCADDDIRSGIEWCVTNKDTYNISVISMSFGGGSYTSYCDNQDDPSNLTYEINQAVNQNISVVIAAGNNGYNDSISFPACIKNAISVGMTYDANIGVLFWGELCVDSTTNLDKIVCASNRNNITDLFAPGALINSTNSSGDYYDEQGGTSMATPMVSAAIALMNQYKRSTTNQIMTPDTIKIKLNNTGENVDDSLGSGLNFSRINILKAIFSIDEEPPNITSMLPENNSLQESQNQSFSCNATDILQFANLTIKIYNSTSLVHNKSTTQESLITYFNTTTGEYNWSCITLDDNSNTQTKTFFLTVNKIITKIISPTNNTYTNQNKTFNCSAKTIDELKNITFSIYNSTNLLLNTTTNISGTFNYSIFNYNFTNEGEYYYNCISFSNELNFSRTENYTITYDITNPAITLLTPENNLRTTTKTHTFTYSTSDSSPIFNCTLILNSKEKSPFTQTLSDATYNWYVNCTDQANNTNSSNTRTLTIYTKSSGSSGSSSSSSSSSSPITIKITNEEIKQGTIKQINKNTKLQFTIKQQTHKLILNKINTTKIDITLQSNPLNLTLYLNQLRKVNLDEANEDNTYDLELTLLSIIEDKVNISIKEINEKIPLRKISINESEIVPPQSKEQSKLNLFQKIIKFFQKILNYIKNNF